MHENGLAGNYDGVQDHDCTSAEVVRHGIPRRQDQTEFGIENQTIVLFATDFEAIHWQRDPCLHPDKAVYDVACLLVLGMRRLEELCLSRRRSHGFWELGQVNLGPKTGIEVPLRQLREAQSSVEFDNLVLGAVNVTETHESYANSCAIYKHVKNVRYHVSKTVSSTYQLSSGVLAAEYLDQACFYRQWT